VSGTLAVDNAARVESKPFHVLTTQAIRMTEILAIKLHHCLNIVLVCCGINLRQQILQLRGAVWGVAA